jgi:phage terminase large subunit GpA-like protein
MEALYLEQLGEILDAGGHTLSTIKPSEWTEKFRSMDASVSRFKGRFSYDLTPYTREIVDCLSPDHPARRISVMKGAQVGFSVGVIEAGTGWIISEQPGNILFLTGHSDLSEEAVQKIDNMIDSCGIRNLIRPNVKRTRGMKTGDTNTKKEFPCGSLVSGSVSNHKLLMQRSVKYGFIDDFDAAKKSSKSDGSTVSLIEQRFASYADEMKLFYISTPRLKQSSNIEPVFMKGDQRRFHVPCPCCGDMIPLHWSVPIQGEENKMGGITWELDTAQELIKGSVGYICQSCGGFFNDSKKYEMNLHGEWKPTAKPSEEGNYSYHLSALYAPHGMYDWEHYVRQFLEANPPGGTQDEALHKTFMNLCLGETYELPGESPKANELQKNIRNYEIGIIPDKTSEDDGNGPIVFLSCTADLNGTPDDARLDYEVLAWSVSGATYSIDQGSIGTFIPREGSKKVKVDRVKWTYENNKPNNVWAELENLLSKDWKTQKGKTNRILCTGIDTGHFTIHAYSYIDKTNNIVFGLKGKDADKYVPFGRDRATFKPAIERDKLFLLEVGLIKDKLADMIKLKWDENADEVQPFGFMNFPQPADGKYSFKNYFEHFESEERKIENNKDGMDVAARWMKKQSTSQNHFWDVRVYQIAIRDIFLYLIAKQYKVKSCSWPEYCGLITKNI